MIKKNPNKLGIEENFLNLLKNIYKIYSYHLPNDERIKKKKKIKPFPPITGTRQGFHRSPFLFNIILKALTNAYERKGK